MDISDDEEEDEEEDEDEDEEDHTYQPTRGSFAGGPSAFQQDVQETLLCYRKYHSYDDIYIDLTYECEEEFERLYNNMITKLFTPDTDQTNIHAAVDSNAATVTASAAANGRGSLTTIVPCTTSSTVFIF